MRRREFLGAAVAPALRGAAGLAGEPKFEGDVSAGEGPSWDKARQVLYFVGNNRISRRDSSGKVEIFREPAGGANGSVVDRQGNLLVCEASARQVTRTGSESAIRSRTRRFLCSSCVRFLLRESRCKIRSVDKSTRSGNTSVGREFIGFQANLRVAKECGFGLK